MLVSWLILNDLKWILGLSVIYILTNKPPYPCWYSICLSRILGNGFMDHIFTIWHKPSRLSRPPAFHLAVFLRGCTGLKDQTFPGLWALQVILAIQPSYITVTCPSLQNTMCHILASLGFFISLLISERKFAKQL